MERIASLRNVTNAPLSFPSSPSPAVQPISSDPRETMMKASQTAASIDLEKVADILSGTDRLYDKVASPWEFDTGHHDSTATVAANGTIYEGGLCDSKLRCFSSEGKLLWEKETDASTVYPYAAPDGTVYVSRTISLQAYNPDGSLKWDLPLPGRKDMDRNSLATHLSVGNDGTAYIYDYGSIYAVDPSGKVTWKNNLEHAWADHPPVIGLDGTVYCLDRQNTLYAFKKNGALKWKNTDWTKDGDKSGGIATITTRLAAGPEGNLCFGTGDGSLVCLDDTGKPRWNIKIDAQMDGYTSPSINPKSGIIYVGPGRDRDGLIALNPRGEELWRNNELGSAFHITALPEGDGVLVSIRGGGTHCLDESGKERWKFPKQITRPAFGGDGTIYVGAGKSLYALNSVEDFAKKMEKHVQENPGERDPSKIEETDGWIIIDNLRIPVNQQMPQSPH
jgi:hypothetical protein